MSNINVGLLLKAVEIKSEKAYNVLLNDYQKTYLIDPSFKTVS